MPPIISIVGKSDAGKTTYLEKLLAELFRRGYKIGTIKHDSHGTFEFDTPGKDSYRHFQSGAAGVVVSGPDRIALQKRVACEQELDWIAFHLLPDVDLVITEGYKSKSKPKIEVLRGEVSTEPLCSEEELAALVTDIDTAYKVPSFPMDDAIPMADFLVKRFLSRPAAPKIRVMSDGKYIPCKEFVRDFLVGGILGMLSSLHGVKDPERVSIEIDLRAGENRG